MTSHVRHRRITDPAQPFPIGEPGELTVNVPNRQIAIGNTPSGDPLALLALRIFSTTSRYAIMELVVKDGGIYRARVLVNPGAFNPGQWEPISGTAETDFVHKSGDVMTGPLEVPEPTIPAHVATKNYVDSLVGNIDLSPFVAKAGSTMTGDLVLHGTPASSLGAVPKTYVDTADALKADAAAVSTALGLKADVTYTDTELAKKADATATTSALALKAPIASPTFTGAPKAPTPVAATNDTTIATTAYVKSNFAPISGAGYLPIAGGTMSGNLASAYSGNVAQGGAAPSFEVRSNSTNACMAFHCLGAFGANFGMATDGNFYMGGWSHGAVAYKFWTTRDFGSLPVYVSNGRLAMAADYGVTWDSVLREPYLGAVVTGNAAWAPGGQYVITTFRYRWMQLYSTSWFTVGTA